VTRTASRLWEETVYLAYYLHWSLREILDLDHGSRDRVIDAVGRINAQLAGEPGFAAGTGFVAGTGAGL
jgi:hypothetical protein